MGAGAVPGGALGLEAAADRHVDGLLDGAGALGTVAEVVLDPLAIGVDVGEQLAQEAVLLRVVGAAGPQLGELGDQPLDIAADGVGQQASDRILPLRPEGLPDAVLQVPQVEEVGGGGEVLTAQAAEIEGAVTSLTNHSRLALKAPCCAASSTSFSPKAAPSSTPA